MTAAVLAVASMVALAADPTEGLLRQGAELQRQGRDGEARPLFQRAYDLERSPRAAAQLGLVELATGDPLAAEGHLAEALASPRDGWITRNRAGLDRALRRAQGAIGEITVRGSPEGALVSVNGKPVGKLPLVAPLRLAEGAAEIGLASPGYVPLTGRVNVFGGGHGNVTISLSPEVAAPLPPPTPAALPSPWPSVVIPEDPVRSTPSWVRPAAWVASGLGVAALSFAGYGFLQMRRNQDAFNARARPATGGRACSTRAPGGLDDVCADLRAGAVQSQGIAIASGGAAALLAAAAAAGFVWSYGGGTSSPELSVSGGPGALAAGAWVRF